jgi:DNA-3-methyladenine glycosylase II
MPDAFQFVMTEHAAWRPTKEGHHRVFALSDGGQWLVTTQGNEPLMRPLIAGEQQPRLDIFALPEGMLSEVPELARALSAMGIVARFRTLDLWDAIGTAIIRQVIRATQAKRLPGLLQHLWTTQHLHEWRWLCTLP